MLLVIGLYFAYLAYTVWIGPKLRTPVDFWKFGEWAVVTGATDGLGKAFARELAKRGMNIVLLSRTRSRLEAVASEIESTFKVRTKCVTADFTNDTSIYPEIQAALAGLKIGVLVNNVGMTFDRPEYFLEIPDRDEFFEKTIHCNVFSTTFMTSMILPQMVERGTGAILNIGSLAATIASPLYTIYGATKAYIDKFSQDMQTEYKEKGILIQSVVPGVVMTKMSRTTRSSWIVPTPETYADSFFRTFALSKREAGYSYHRLLLHLMEMYTFFASDYASGQVLGQTKALRTRYLTGKKTKLRVVANLFRYLSYIVVILAITACLM